MQKYKYTSLEKLTWVETLEYKKIYLGSMTYTTTTTKVLIIVTLH